MRVVRYFAIAAVLACQNAQRPRDTTSPHGDGPVALRNGRNEIDLLGDGTRTQVFVAYRGNFNAHGASTVAIYLHSPSDADTVKEWLIVPRFGGPDDGDVGREIYSTTEGADCTLGDLRLVQHRKATAELIVARRELGGSFSDSAATHFDYYRLTKNTDGVPGWPLWYFEFVRTVAARRSYCDVNVAFEQELHLGRHGLGRGEASE